jgi:uncharacterized protein YjbI with pentapeptide repeats
MKTIRPLQLSCNQIVLEQNRKFYFTFSATLGINLQTNEELLDINYIKDSFECMDDKPQPDTGMPKPNGEYLIFGSFHSPNKKPVTGGEVKVILDKIDKNLFIFGDRKWEHDKPSKPKEISSLPLDYSYAFGGAKYKKNPDGIGYKDDILPNIEDPKNLIASKDDKPEPAGFSTLNQLLPQRTKYQGTYGSDYKEKYFPGYPEDMDWKYFLCAPKDQQIKEFYRGDEHFELYNMHPEIPEIIGNLPGLYPRCFLNQKNGEIESFGELPLKLDTISFYPEKLLALLTWRGVIEVSDDEAETVTAIITGYEKKGQDDRSIEYYQKAFEKRKNSDDSLLINLNTQDLIPEGHKCAMELLMDTALSDTGDSEFANNINAKAESIQKMADKKIEEAIKQVEKQIADIKIPDEALAKLSGENGKLDIRALMKSKPDSETNLDVKKINDSLESILPGITAGDPKKLDMKNFSFDKIDEIMDVFSEFSDKKVQMAKGLATTEIEKSKITLLKQIDDVISQIENTLDKGDVATLKKTKDDLKMSTAELEKINLNDDTEIKAPLPRIDTEEIIAQLSQVDAQTITAMQHLQAAKAQGIKDENLDELEKSVQKNICDRMKQAENGIREAEISFKETYIMAAHFMKDGLSPHKESLSEVKEKFLKAIANSEDISNRDWACIDLSGQKLDGVDLSGSYLEQVNFTGASLKGANFNKAILVRANFEDTDFSKANFEDANIGGVNALRTNFTDTNMKKAKLSKGDFTDSNFTRANLEEIESLDITINGALFSETLMPKVTFLETKINGAKFPNADMNTSIFLKCDISDTDFSQAIMTKCTFADVTLNDVIFNHADLSGACFAATDPEKSTMKNLQFNGATLKQTNFQNMDLKKAQFIGADLENSNFGSANLSEADFSNSYAKGTQFRKANLMGANFNGINLMEGSLAKACLVNASFKKANLYAVDFLRSTITNTDFSKSNLELTLIENWRPG